MKLNYKQIKETVLVIVILVVFLFIDNILNLIKYPIITEKAVALSKKNQYTFFVDRLSSKNQIKTTIQNIFNTKRF